MLLDSVVNRRIQESDSADSAWRSLAKTVSWRVIGTLDTILISYIITGEATMALSIGSIEVFSKMILYYLHERLWAQAKVRK